MFIKICGITNTDDALLAAGLGADAIGLLFTTSSREIAPSVGRDIVRHLPPEILSVGVFRNERKERVVEIANKVGLRAVQLHGHETPEETKWIAARVPSVIRALASTNPAIRRFERYSPARLLIDSSTPGSGQVFDWDELEKLRISEPYILAGGLDPTNVAMAIQQLHPWGVDISSGVEESPGKKDAVKMRKFINEARSANSHGRAERTSKPKPYNWEED